MGLQVFTVLFTRFAGVFFVLFYVAMVYATVTPEDPVTIKVLDSEGNNKWSCSAATTKIRSVRFQSVLINGISFERTFIDQRSLTSDGQIVQKNFTAANLGSCLLAAGRAGVDAIRYNNSVCSGYIIKNTLNMCPCSSDADTVVFMRKDKTTITQKRPLFNESVASGAYTKTVVYSDILADEAARQTFIDTDANCEANIGGSITGDAQYLITSGSCYTGYIPYNASYCTSCSGTPVTVYTSATSQQASLFFSDICGTTITYLGDSYYAFSHAAYGCSYYPQPTTATDCEVTFALGAGVTGLEVLIDARLSSSGSTCNDELVIYNGNSSGTEVIRTCDKTFTSLGRILSQVTFVFKRKPPVTGASAPFGFQVMIQP